LEAPQEVTDATNDYRDEQDTIGQFIAATCATGDELWVSTGALRAAYVKWCSDENEQPLSSKAFGARMTERGHISDRATVNGTTARIWRGIGICS